MLCVGIWCGCGGQRRGGMSAITANGAYIRAFQVKFGEIVEFIKSERSVYAEFVCADLPKFFFFEIELVLNIADQLLKNVLQRHHANGSPKLIHHQCKMCVFAQE